MTFHEKVNWLCKQRGMAITSLIKELGFSKSAATTWKNSENWPRNSTIKAIADYFVMTVDELTEDIDEPIDYINYDTSGFDQLVYRRYLDACKGDVKQAIKRYLDFDKQKTHDAMNDPARIALYQNKGIGVIENARAPVTINNGTERTLSDQETEILRIFSGLTLIEQSKVLIYAAELKEKK